jgi:GNAT superfamily N-acetyltransferase
MRRIIDEMLLDDAGLTYSFYVNPDSCSDPAIHERYLSFSALTDNAEGNSKTHVYIEEDEHTKIIIGFISLRCSSLFFKHEDAFTGHPVLEVFDLAVHKDFERQGIGTALIDYALLQAMEINTHHAGVRHLVLFSDPKSEGFYLRQGFRRISEMYDIPDSIWNRDCVPMIINLF